MKNITIGFCIWLAGLIAAFGQTGDFSRGFAKLYDIGLPDVAGAEYVKLDVYPSGMNYDYVWAQLGLSGNAWKLPGSKVPAHFVHGQTQILEVYKPEELSKLLEEEGKAQGKTNDMAKVQRRMRFGMASSGRVSGQWQPANLSRDIQKVTEYLEKKTDNQNNMDWQLSSGGGGSLFLFAAHVYRQGYTNEAGRMARALFEKAGDKRRILAQGVNQIADGQYTTAYSAFQQTRDWTKFRESLNALATRFPVGWQKAGAVQRLARLIDTQLQTKNAPRIEDKKLSAEDQALATALITKPKDWQRNFSPQSLWIFTPSANENMGIPVESDSALKRIRDGGLKSIPLLIALLSDSWLTEWSTEDVRGHTVSWSTSDSNPMDEEMVDRLFRNMNRPATRSDLARFLLSPLLISDEEYSSSIDQLNTDDFRAKAEAWYQEHATNTMKDLAQSYLAQGSRDQKEEALKYLIVVLPKEDLPTLQKYLVDDDNPERSLQNVIDYAAVRGKDATAFVDEYIEKIRKARENNADEEFHENAASRASAMQYFSNQVLQLKNLVAGRSVEDTLKAVATGKEKMDSARLLLIQRLKNAKPDAILEMVLRAAVEAPDPGIRKELIEFLMQTSIGRQKMMALYGDATGAAPVEFGLHAELWSKLLEDKRPLTKLSLGPSITMADNAAWWITYLYGTDANIRKSATLTRLGRRGQDLMLEQARLRLEGKSESDLPPVPSADALTSTNRQEMIRSLTAAGADQIPAVVAKWNLNEWLAAAEEAGKNTSLNQKLLPIAQRITKADAPADKKIAEKIKGYEGRLLDRKIVEELLDLCRQEVGEGRPLVVIVQRQACLDGVILQIQPPPADDQPGLSRLFRATTEPTVNGLCYVQGRPSVNASWNLKPKSKPADSGKQAEGKASAEDDLLNQALSELSVEAGNDQDNEQTAFWNCLNEIIAGPSSAIDQAVLILSGCRAGEATKTNTEVPHDVVE